MKRFPIGVSLCVLFLSSALWAAACRDSGSEMERAVVSEMNRVRQNPKKYAASLEALLPLYDSANRRRLGPSSFLTTQEGKPAVLEAITVLRKTKSVKPLRWNSCLQRSAVAHVKDQGPRGTYGHSGSKGSTFVQRIRKQKVKFRAAGENIGYGSESAEDVVRELIIDDGVPDRGHRRNILSPKFNEAGVGCGPHSNLRAMCVIDFIGT